MTTPRQLPQPAPVDARGTRTTDTDAPDQPARDQVTKPVSINGLVLSGSDQAGEPAPDASTARMDPAEILVSAPCEPARRTRPTTAPVRVVTPPVAGTRIGQYELIRSLGRGDMGEVYLARDLRFGRLVALRRLRAAGPGLVERFLREARATARCTHENIAVIHEVGEASALGGDPYMALEYLEGQTLRQWLREHAAIAGAQAPVPPGRAVALMLPVVRALAYAHERGLVHRDLKPENVMLTRSGVIKVLDFGIARLLRASGPDEEDAGDGVPDRAADPDSGPATLPPGTRSSALIGTLPYMSPEQMNAGAIDARSDVWAAGIMLFELVTGRHPMPTFSVAHLMRIADTDEPMPGVREAMPDRAADIGALAGVIERCLIKDPRRRTPSARALLAELEALAPGRGAARVGADGCPFPGLAAFQEADADRFFGREPDIVRIVTALRGRPLVTVAGPSGAGKSSLVRAGVIPALARSGEGWDAHIVRPGRAPLAALAMLLHDLARASVAPDEAARDPADTPADQTTAQMHGAALGHAIARLRRQPGHLGARLRSHATSKRRRVVVLVDALEELYTLGAAPDERETFLACLAAVADDAASPLRVIATMRSDFLDRLAGDRRLGPEVGRGLVLLPPMGRDGMREALLRPLEAAEHRFESTALVERMLDALAAAPGALPLLQFTAARLWELRDPERRLLTAASYERLGGVAGALAGHADAVLAGMPGRDARLARAVFLRLVTPERTRRLATLAELRDLGRTSGDMDRVLARLLDARLLAVASGAGAHDAGDPGETGRVVEIVHESLIDTWPALGRWLAEREADAVTLARLRSAAADWERGGRAPGLRWTGQAAHEARAWQQRYQGELAPAERRYLDAVAGALERSRRVRRRLVGAALAVAVVIALAMAWLA
jgi:serine/threonine protein kinase